MTTYNQLWQLMTIHDHLWPHIFTWNNMWTLMPAYQFKLYLVMTSFDYLWPIITSYDQLWPGMTTYMTNDDQLELARTPFYTSSEVLTS